MRLRYRTSGVCLNSGVTLVWRMESWYHGWYATLFAVYMNEMNDKMSFKFGVNSAEIYYNRSKC